MLDGGGGAQDSGTGYAAFLSPAFRALGWRRHELCAQLVMAGFSTWCTDLDVVWFRNPLGCLSQGFTLDVLVSAESPDLAHANNGVYFVRPTPAGRAFMANSTLRELQASEWDMEVANRLLASGRREQTLAWAFIPPVLGFSQCTLQPGQHLAGVKQRLVQLWATPAFSLAVFYHAACWEYGNAYSKAEVLHLVLLSRLERGLAGGGLLPEVP